MINVFQPGLGADRCRLRKSVERRPHPVYEVGAGRSPPAPLQS